MRLMPIFDFTCQSCGDKYERLVPRYIDQDTCLVCGGITKPGIGCPHLKIDGTDPSFPTAWNSWEKKRNQKMKQELKQEG